MPKYVIWKDQRAKDLVPLSERLLVSIIESLLRQWSELEVARFKFDVEKEKMG